MFGLFIFAYLCKYAYACYLCIYILTTDIIMFTSQTYEPMQTSVLRAFVENLALYVMHHDCV